MKRWTQIFKALANINRLKIIQLLYSRGRLTVSEIAHELEISFRATSKHLILLHGLDVLTSLGKDGHVFYDFNRSLPQDIKKVIGVFLKAR